MFRTAEPYQIESAAQWYSDAYTVADALAAKFGVSVETAVGVIAVLSPMNSWGNNINLAGRIMAQGGHATGGGLPANVAKANRLMLGESPAVVVGGQKVTNFYKSILTRGAEGVTIDRHAFDIATNTRHTDANRPGISKSLYSTISDMYTRAASILSAEHAREITAGQVQSVTWMVWRARYWAAGAWDGHTAI